MSENTKLKNPGKQFLGVIKKNNIIKVSSGENKRNEEWKWKCVGTITLRVPTITWHWAEFGSYKSNNCD